MAKAYRIVQWSIKYERSDTRKTDYMPWFAKQTKLVGLGIGKLMREPYPRNMELFGLWTLLETLASQSAVEHRGWLVRDGVPLDFEGMASLVPTVPPEAFAKVCDWFCKHLPGWFEYVEFVPAGSGARERGGKSPGGSPDNLPAGSGARERGGRNSATDRQRDSTQTDRETGEREEEALRVQFAAANGRVQELERKAAAEELSEEEDAELREMRQVRGAVQKKQARGKKTAAREEQAA